MPMGLNARAHSPAALAIAWAEPKVVAAGASPGGAHGSPPAKSAVDKHSNRRPHRAEHTNDQCCPRDRACSQEGIRNRYGFGPGSCALHVQPYIAPHYNLPLGGRRPTLHVTSYRTDDSSTES